MTKNPLILLNVLSNKRVKDILNSIVKNRKKKITHPEGVTQEHGLYSTYTPDESENHFGMFDHLDEIKGDPHIYEKRATTKQHCRLVFIALLIGKQNIPVDFKNFKEELEKIVEEIRKKIYNRIKAKYDITAAKLCTTEEYFLFNVARDYFLNISTNISDVFKNGITSIINAESNDDE